ncbi:MAG: amino acid ABC transporter permease [Clostridia bacterium]
MSFGTIFLKLLDGFGTSVMIFFVTLLLALPLGLLVSFGSGSKNKYISAIFKFFVWIIRGTPLMLQIMVIFFAPGLVFHIPMKPIMVGILKIDPRIIAVLVAFIINYSAYFSEIFRGGIASISKGQLEAGQVLGINQKQIFNKIIFLQVVKRILPPMSNEIITLVKDTSLAKVVAVSELIFVAGEITAVTGKVWPLFFTGIFYLIFCGGLTVLFNYLEKKLSYFRG